MSSLFGSSSGQDKEQKALTTSETNLVNFGLSQAEGTLPAATSAANQSLSFFQKLLSGDRNSIMSALTPQISSLTSQYGTAERTAEQFAPRGGGRAATLQQQPQAEASQIQQLVGGAQAEGAQGVTSVASLLADIGLGEIGASSSTAANTANQLETSKTDAATTAASTGSAIGSLIALLAGA